MTKAIVVRLDPNLARDLERFAPARSRGQSQFIRKAIRRALLDLEEIETRRAYERMPDDEPVAFIPETWDREDWHSQSRARPVKRKAKGRR